MKSRDCPQRTMWVHVGEELCRLKHFNIFMELQATSAYEVKPNQTATQLKFAVNKNFPLKYNSV
jgi:hypothetical protein